MPNNKNMQKSIGVQHAVAMVQRSAPLPTPSEMQMYDSIVPGAAERILIMAEKEQAARLEHQANEDARIKDYAELEALDIKNEKDIISINGKNSIVGLWMGFFIALVVIAASVYLVVSGHPVVGTIFGGSSFVTVIAILVYGPHIKKREILSLHSQNPQGNAKS